MSTKIHAAGDALGNPVRLIGSPGQRNDIAFAHELIEGFAADVTIADKGYDADHLCDRIAQTGSEVVIPPKRNRSLKRPYDTELYKERNIIERFFNKLKQFRLRRHPLRQAARQLHGLRQTRRHRNLAQIVKCHHPLGRGDELRKGDSQKRANQI